MDERVVAFRVGVLVMITVVVTVILVLLFGELPGFAPETYRIYVTFAEAEGISRDTPVRKSGILVGRVRDVQLVDGVGVLVTADINSQYRLRRNEVCRIDGTLLGDAALQFTQVQNPNVPNDELQSGETIPGVVARDPLQAIGDLQGDLTIAIDAVARTSDEIGILARRVTQLIDSNDDQLRRIVDKTEGTLDQINAAANSTNALLNDPVLTENLRRSAAELPQILAETRSAVGNLRSTMMSAERNLTNIEGLTRPLGERGEELINKIDMATTNLNATLTELSVFSRALNDPDGSVNRLLNDRELYARLNSIAINVEELTVSLKPIVADARVITDKAARHPEVLGIRGAIFPSSGIK